MSISVRHTFVGPPARQVLFFSAHVTSSVMGAGVEGTGITVASVIRFQPASGTSGRVAEQGEKDASTDDSKKGRHEVNSPEKPMNARDNVPARISTSPMFRATAGTSESSVCSRREAMRTRASVTPRPAPTA